MTDRHPDDDLLVDLALSDIDEPLRDTLTSHLALCEPCRARYTAVADSVDHVLAAAPRVAPPAGFSKLVLATMGIADHDHPGTRPATLPQGSPQPGQHPGAGGPRQRPAAQVGAPSTAGMRARVRSWGRPRAWVVAVAAALALLVGAAGTAIVLDRSRRAGAEIAAVGPALTTEDGTRVGTVLDGWYDGQPVLVVTLTNGPVGVRYDCQLVLVDGTRQSGGSWVLGEPSGATWVMPRPDTDVTSLELVTDTGATWASARM